MRVNLACELARKAPLVIHLDAEPVPGYETVTEIVTTTTHSCSCSSAGGELVQSATRHPILGRSLALSVLCAACDGVALPDLQVRWTQVARRGEWMGSNWAGHGVLVAVYWHLGRRDFFHGDPV